ncbi:hypothetical protein KM043_008710 [Ampulex compressa]|nr:hypothetical protein KM043_008710 [Ampulex compressa]
MADRRSRYSSSARDKTPSIIVDSTKIHPQNFITEFLKYCELHDVWPVPHFKERSRGRTARVYLDVRES